MVKFLLDDALPQFGGFKFCLHAIGDDDIINPLLVPEFVLILAQPLVVDQFLLVADSILHFCLFADELLGTHRR